MNTTTISATPDFARALAAFPEGYVEGRFHGRRWGSTVKRSDDGRRIWLFAKELGGKEIVSFNLYLLSSDRPMLQPREMASEKVTRFVIGFVPDRKT